jgi:putative polyketide hydroxylase
MIEAPVLIVGGGPVGLTASMLLSQHDVRSLLVERHPGTATLPKARGINARTMEMYRQMGVETAIREAGMPSKFGSMIVWAESLAGAEINRIKPGRGSAANLAVTPVANCGCAQDDFEPVLRRHAEAAVPDGLRFHTELTDVSYDAEGVTGTLTDRIAGTQLPFRARYLIAADGAQSAMRQKLGVRMIGERDVYDSVNILFRADLRQWTAERPAALYFIEQPELRGTFLTINGTDRWSFLVHSLKQYGYSPADFTPERCMAIIRQAVGVPDLPVEILGVGAWKASAVVADHYRDGPIFLAGDAAHEMPPTGGFGLNTGVQDVHNLAWKLAAVLHGHAEASLLDTYDTERRPLAELITRTSLLNALSMGRTARQDSAKLPRPEFLNEQGLVFGPRYVSSAVIPDGTAPPSPANPITEYVASAHPGCRAPHVWLSRDGEKISTIDLFGPRFVLLAGPSGLLWREAASRQSQLTLTTYIIGEDVEDSDGQWLGAYGVEDSGAVLVRPDGYVAWRMARLTTDPASALATAIEQLLGRTDAVQADSHEAVVG